MAFRFILVLAALACSSVSARHLDETGSPGHNFLPWSSSPATFVPTGKTVADLEQQLSLMDFPSKEDLSGRDFPFSVDIEGIVGTGKSTCLNFFKPYPGFDILTEPVDKWTDLNGTDLLQLIYDDPKRWALAQESYVQQTMLEGHLRNVGVAKIQERSVHSARFVFSEYFYGRGLLQPVEYAILDGWFQLLHDVPEFHLTHDLTVYLRNDPRVALERVRARGRKEEAAVSLRFLEGIHRLHEDWLVHRNTSFPLPSKNILVIDASESLEKCQQLYEFVAKRVSEIVPSERGKRKQRKNCE